MHDTVRRRLNGLRFSVWPTASHLTESLCVERWPKWPSNAEMNGGHQSSWRPTTLSDQRQGNFTFTIQQHEDTRTGKAQQTSYQPTMLRHSQIDGYISARTRWGSRLEYLIRDFLKTNFKEAKIQTEPFRNSTWLLANGIPSLVNGTFTISRMWIPIWSLVVKGPKLFHCTN